MAVKKLPKPSKIGRPFKFKSRTILQNKIDDYFKSLWVFDQKENKAILYKTPSVPGLAQFLGVTKDTIYNYLREEREDRQYVREVFEQAMLKIEEFIVENGLLNKTNSAMSMFVLKNNFGWKDKTEIDQNNTGEITFKFTD